MSRALRSLMAVGLLAVSLAAQTEQAYEQDEAVESRSLLDPSRFSIHHSVSFGMAGSSTSNLKSQSLYSTMIQYRFAKPVTLNLNFGLPLHSTYNDARNLNWDNVESLDYFKNMPFDVSLSWQPREDMLLRLTVSKRSLEDYYYGQMNSPYFFNTLNNRWEW
ncbi:MAG: hypothetical protein GF331_05325 [Chitinivibrionales bacterium]|nr:hypothetical protein [Chitinivibrionales bacterium]